MERFIRNLLVVVGVVAVLWLVRDRFVTVGQVPASEPVSFRVAPPDRPSPPVDLVAIPGIGPVYAERLAAAGFPTAGALAQANPDAVAEAAQVSASRATEWIGAARHA